MVLEVLLWMRPSFSLWKFKFVPLWVYLIRAEKEKFLVGNFRSLECEISDQEKKNPPSPVPLI